MTSEGPALTPNPLCQRCVEAIQGWFNQLPHYLTALSSFKAKSLVPQGGGTPVTGSSEPSVPINLDVLDVQDSIIECLYVDVPIYELQFQPEGVFWAEQIQKAWHKADGIVGFAPRWSRRWGACERCEASSLGAWDGADEIACQDCGYTLSREAYAQQCIKQSMKKKEK